MTATEASASWIKCTTSLMKVRAERFSLYSQTLRFSSVYESSTQARFPPTRKVGLDVTLTKDRQ
jgi:hypothetical protein